jgi:hypothetical protein
LLGQVYRLALILTPCRQDLTVKPCTSKTAKRGSMPLLPQPRPPLIVWPIRHNTWEEVIGTTMHHEKHEVSRISIDGCGTNNVRV